MQDSQKSFILFLLLFIQNHQPILSTIEEDKEEFHGASAYIPKSPLAYDCYDKTDKKPAHNIPNRPKRSPSLGKYGSETPSKFMLSKETLAIIEYLKKQNKLTQ